MVILWGYPILKSVNYLLPYQKRELACSNFSRKSRMFLTPSMPFHAFEAHGRPEKCMETMSVRICGISLINGW